MITFAFFGFTTNVVRRLLHKSQFFDFQPNQSNGNLQFPFFVEKFIEHNIYEQLLKDFNAQLESVKA